MASRHVKITALGVSTLLLLAFFRKLKELKRRKAKLIKSKEKLRRKVKSDRPIKVQKSTLELYDSDSEAQRAKRPRLEEEEIEKSEDEESIESIESSSDSDSSDESCYSSLISNTESDSTHSESFITDTDDELDEINDTTEEIENEPTPQIVKPEIFDDPLATINYEDEDRKPDLDELTEALRMASKDNDDSEATVRIKEEPRFF